LPDPTPMSVDAPTAIPESVGLEAGTPGWVSVLAKLTAVGAFCVVVAGSAVTSTRSGLADEHWPTFSGQAVPSFKDMSENRGLFYEHSHRIIAGTVGILTLLLAVSLWTAPEPRRWVRRLGVAAAVIVVILAVLGGLTVLLKLPPQVSIVHVSVAMVFLGCATSLACVTGKRWRSAREELHAGKGMVQDESIWLARGAVFCVVAVYVQIVLGAVPRHVHAGVIPHIIWAFAVFTAVVMVVMRVLGRHSGLPGLFRPGMLLLFLTGLQFFLGFTTFLVRPSAAKAAGTGQYELFASFHQATGALMLIASVLLMLRALRFRYLLRRGIVAPTTREVMA